MGFSTGISPDVYTSFTVVIQELKLAKNGFSTLSTAVNNDVN